MKKSSAFVLGLVLLSVLLIPSPTAGFQLPSPDHGVEDGFDKLWSKHSYNAPRPDGTVEEYLTRSSDYIYVKPPSAPDKWNGEEVDEFDGGGIRASVHPEDANLTDSSGGMVRDAYISVFAISPSTLVHFSPDKSILYVDDFGEVHAFIDYRTQSADTTDLEVEVIETGDSVTDLETGGFSVDYAGLQGEELTLQARVTATRNTPQGEVTEEVVVEDSVGVKPYNVSSRQTIALFNEFPNGDKALFAVRGTPWSSIRLPNNATVRSNWRFFSARDTDWDEPLVVSRGSGGKEREGESYHPLQVHAYPSKGGVYTEGEVRVRDTLGDRYAPPELPEGVSVDTHSSTYTTVRAADIRYNGTQDAEVSGIINGQKGGVRKPPVSQQIKDTNLTVTSVGRTSDGFTLRVSLRDEDGNPIDTRSAGGYIRLEGRRNVTTELDGTATVDVTARPSSVILARYIPNDWHDSLNERRGQTPYVGDTDTVTLEDDFDLIAELGSLIQLFVLMLPFLLVVYFLDKILKLGIWPPWKRI